MPVVDASAAVAVLALDTPNEELVARIAAGDLHAPHLLDVEFLHALRRLVATGGMSLDRAVSARSDFADLPILRYPHPPLADRVWELRENLTAYDAAYIALSETLDLPLVTTDARLAGSSGHEALIEKYVSS